MPVYGEPLDAALWFKRIALIANGGLDSVESSLRHAAHLLEMTPEELRPFVGLAVDPESFEALLERGDLDTAARCLVAQPTALSFEGENGADLIRATIQCVALNKKVHGIGASVAKSVLNAWTTCLLSLKAQNAGDLSRLLPQPASTALDPTSVVGLEEARARRTAASSQGWSCEDEGSDA